MRKEFQKINDIKEKSNALDFILFATIAHVENHDKKELKIYIKTWIERLNIKCDFEIEDIYINRLIPLIDLVKINIGQSTGDIKSISIFEFSLDICTGIKILNENHFKRFKPNSQYFYDFQEKLLENLQFFINPPLKKLTRPDIKLVITEYKKIQTPTKINNMSLNSDNNLFKRLPNVLKYAFFNIPTAIIILWIIRDYLLVNNISYSIPKKILEFSQVLGILYAIGMLYYLIFLIVRNTNLLKSFKEYKKNEDVSIILGIGDKIIPNGIAALLTSMLLSGLILLKDKMIEFYNNTFIDYLRELGTTISGISQNIVFEPTQLIGFDFLTIDYIITYCFQMILSFSSVFFIIAVALCILIYRKKTKKDSNIIFFVIVLNTIILMSITNYYTDFTNKISFKKILLEEELNKNDNHQIVITYPLLKDILKDPTYTVSIKVDSSEIENKKLGLVSNYYNDKLNIIHPVEVFCQLRNFNLVNRDQASIGMYDLIDGFVTDNKSYTVNIKSKDPRKNVYDIEISNQTKTDTKKIENTQLEYDYDKVHFKKFDVDTGVYLKCKDSLYSKYLNNTNVGYERFKGMDTIMDEMFKSVKLEHDENIYMYKGRNINDLNPYKCEQMSLLNKKNDKTSMSIDEIIYGGICIGTTKDFKEFIKNKLDEIKYN